MDAVDVICRQTNYTKEESLAKLHEFNGDILKIIHEYLDVTEPKPKNNNNNPHRFIHDFMNFKNRKPPS